MLLRTPRLLHRVFRRHISRFKFAEPLAENIDVNSAILSSLSLYIYKEDEHQTGTKQRGKTVYELQLPELKRHSNYKNVIWTLSQWSEIVDRIMENPRSYPESVPRDLLLTCPLLVYSSPDDRQELLERILRGLIENEYPISTKLYHSYLAALHEMKVSPDMEKVLGELSSLGLQLSYRTDPERKLADLICLFLALEGRSEELKECWTQFARSASFRGFTTRSFAGALVAHAVRGEIGELSELQHHLQRQGYLTPGTLRTLTLALARSGQLSILQSVLPLNTMNWRLFIPLCIELVRSGQEEAALDLLDSFQGIRVESAVHLRSMVCDLISRGALILGSEIFVRGGELFRFPHINERGLFENQTLREIAENSSANVDDFMVALELSGVMTGHEFSVEKISPEMASVLGDATIEGNPLLEHLYSELVTRHEIVF